jgi:hypothetical protein
MIAAVAPVLPFVTPPPAVSSTPIAPPPPATVPKLYGTGGPSTLVSRASESRGGLFDGFVAKYMGDGVLIYFGYARVHEDDAERAVRAGLGVVDAVARIDVKSAKLQTRTPGSSSSAI